MNDKIHGVTLPKGEKLLKYCRSRNCQCQEYVKCKKDGKRYHVPQCPIQKHLNIRAIVYWIISQKKPWTNICGSLKMQI